MAYIRTKDGIVKSDMATHILTKDICDAGYCKILKKGSLCKIGETWTNFYGKWTSIIDVDGKSYDIRPGNVKEVVKELPQADTIEELCDEFVYENEKGNKKIVEKILTFGSFMYDTGEYELKYGAIWTDEGLVYVAKLNDKGELELI